MLKLGFANTKTFKKVSLAQIQAFLTATHTFDT